VQGLTCIQAQGRPVGPYMLSMMRKIAPIKVKVEANPKKTKIGLALEFLRAGFCSPE